MKFMTRNVSRTFNIRGSSDQTGASHNKLDFILFFCLLHFCYKLAVVLILWFLTRVNVVKFFGILMNLSSAGPTSLSSKNTSEEKPAENQSNEGSPKNWAHETRNIYYNILIIIIFLLRWLEVATTSLHCIQYAAQQIVIYSPPRVDFSQHETVDTEWILLQGYPS